MESGSNKRQRKNAAKASPRKKTDFIIAVEKAADSSKVHIGQDAFKYLTEYNVKWRPKHKKNWNASLIKAVIMDGAIKMASKEGLNEVSKIHVEKTMLSFHPDGDIDKCYGAGLKIVDSAYKKQINFSSNSLHHFANKFIVKKSTI